MILTLPRTQSLLRSFLAVTAALLLFAAAPARAQFNGPNPQPLPAPVGPAPLTADTSLLFPTPEDLVLRAGDLLAIQVYGDADYRPIVRIGSDGNIALPLVGPVHVEDLTLYQTEQLISEKLTAAGMYRTPQIIIQVTEGTSSSVTVMGELHGVLPVVGSRHLFDVLAAAGVFPPTASHVITIQRRGREEPIVVDIGTDPLHSAAANVTVLPGDTIIVSRIGIVYVLGAFKTTGIVQLTSYAPLTLTELSALSGGASYEAENSALRIIRTDATGRRSVAKFDLQHVIKGKAPDPILQPGDIVYMPSNPVRAVLSNGTFGTVLGIVSIALSLRNY